MIQFLITGFFWFTSSAFLSTYANSTYLKTFADPVLHTFIRFAGSAILGTVTLLVTKQVKVSDIPVTVKRVAKPAVFLFIANYANSIALEKTGITLTYIIKACIPVFTVVICSIQGERYSFMLYTSLLPICIGVALACAGDLDFDIQGLTAGLCRYGYDRRVVKLLFC
jgi:drug/metabolite transporter (DMT)-like permease